MAQNYPNTFFCVARYKAGNNLITFMEVYDRFGIPSFQLYFNNLIQTFNTDKDLVNALNTLSFQSHESIASAQFAADIQELLGYIELRHSRLHV